MPSMWLPGATVIKASSDGGSMPGGPKKVVWHTTENNPNKASATSVAKFLKSVGYEVHLVWNPVSGQIVQMIPANRGAKGLKNAAGGVQTNRSGTYVIQIEVVGQAAHPFTDGPCVGLPKILAWIESLGIPPVWPTGAPKAYPSSSYNRSRTSWAKSGHFGHSQVPENTHGDPGKVNILKLTARQPVAPVKANVIVIPAPLHDAGDNMPRAMRHLVHLPVDGKWDAETDRRLMAIRAHQTSTRPSVGYLQRSIGVTETMVWTTANQASYVAALKTLQANLGVKGTGVWDAATQTKFAAARAKWRV